MKIDDTIQKEITTALASGQWRRMTFEENLRCKRYPETATRRQAIADHFRFIRSHDPALARRAYALIQQYSREPLMPIHRGGNA